MRLPYLRGIGLMEPWGAPSELNPVTGVVTSPGRDSQGRTYGIVPVAAGGQRYLLDTSGRCMDMQASSSMRADRMTNIPCNPGGIQPVSGYRQSSYRQSSYGEAPYAGRVLDYRAQTGWNPSEADAAQAQLRDFQQQTIQQPGAIISDSLVSAQQTGGTFLPSAPSGAPAMQIEEFAAQPESVLPAMHPVAAPEKSGMSQAQILAILAAGALAYFWMKSHA